MSNDLQQQEQMEDELPEGFDHWLEYFRIKGDSKSKPTGGLSQEQIDQLDDEWDEEEREYQNAQKLKEWNKIQKEIKGVKGPMSKAFEFDTEVTEKNMLGRTKTKVVSSKKGEHSDEKTFDTRTMAKFAKVQEKQQQEMIKYTDMMMDWEKRYLAAGATTQEVNAYWKMLEPIVGENFLPNRGVDYVRLFLAINPAMQEVIQEAKLEEEQKNTAHDDIKGKFGKVKKVASKLISLIPDDELQQTLTDLLDGGESLFNMTVDAHKTLTEKDSKDGVELGGNALTFLVSNTAGEDVGEMCGNLTDLFSKGFNTIKDGGEIKKKDPNAPLDHSIQALIEQYEKKKALIDSANKLFEKGIEVAAEFFAPLALLTTGKEFIENLLDGFKWADSFNKASDMMLLSQSTDDVYQHPIAQRLLRNKIEISKATVDGVANLARMVGQTLEMTPVGGVGAAIDKGAALLKKGAKFIFKQIDKRECRKAWKLYKEALNSDDRIAKKKVFKHHAHLAFLAFAYGALEEKNTVCIQMCIDAGLTMENLQHQDTDLKIVAKFFALEGGDLDMTLQPEEKPGTLEKTSKVLSDAINNRETGIAETPWTATDLSLTLTAFQKNCSEAEKAGWYASGTSKIITAFKNYEKLQKLDTGENPKATEQHLRAISLVAHLVRQYDPVNQVGGQVHQGMSKYLSDLYDKLNTEQTRLFKQWNESAKKVNTGWNADHIEIEFTEKFWSKVKKEARKAVGWEGKSTGLSSPLKKVEKADKELAKARKKQDTKKISKYAKEKAKGLLKLMKVLQGWKEAQPGMARLRERLIEAIQEQIPPESANDEQLEQELKQLQQEGGEEEGEQEANIDPLEMEAELISEDDQLMKELAELCGGEEARDELEDKCNELKEALRKKGDDAKFWLDQLQTGKLEPEKKKQVEKFYKANVNTLKDIQKQYLKARKKYNAQLKQIKKDMAKMVKEEKKTNEQIAKAEMLVEYSRAYQLILSRELENLHEDFMAETEEAMNLSDQIYDIITSKFQVPITEEELDEELEQLAKEEEEESEELKSEDLKLEMPSPPQQPIGGSQGEKPPKQPVKN